MDAILTKNVIKNYGSNKVVRNLNLTVPKGAIYGFIGKNGAGKSTTQKMVCGLVNATEGKIELFGKPVTDQGIRRKIGSLIEQPGIYPNMTTFANALMQAYNLGLQDPSTEALQVLRVVGLEDAMKKKAKNLSLGMKQRLGLAISLLGDPELLVLDEPINGLDPEGIVEFRNILERLNKQGITIFISSHILGELSKIATHYGIINEGVLVEELTAEELMAKRQSYLQINVANASGALELLKKELNTTKYELINENELHLLDMQDTGAVNYILSKNDFKVREIFLHHQDLEEYFLELMGGK